MRSGTDDPKETTVIEVKATKTPAKPTIKAKTKIAKAKTAAKPKTVKAKKTTPIKKTVCPVCVNGRGEYANIAKHNKKHHGGRTPEVK